jgi:3-dehydroquinate dehydratase-2
MRKLSSGSGHSPHRRGGVLVIHGPNLNLLGTREPGMYGTDTLDIINRRLRTAARRLGSAIDVFQSNHEGALIERIHAAKNQEIAWIIVNPGGFTHTSVALRDAFAAVQIPFIEVHLSNIYARETFRRHSYFSDLAVGTVCGFGSQGYDFALEFALANGQASVTRKAHPRAS